MTQPNERKPVVIPIEDGDALVRRRICMGAWQAIVTFSRTTDDADGHPQIDVGQQAIGEPLYTTGIGIIPLELDVAAEAELKERERCRREANRWFNARPLVMGAAVLISAIDAPDAPDETVSEYVAGQRAMKSRCLNEARHWLPRSENAVNRAEFDSMLAGLDCLTPMLEPPK